MARAEKIILLDTHVWVWSVDKNPRLDPRLAAMISESEGPVCVSVISCWEIAMLVSKGRIDLGVPANIWFDTVIAESGIVVLPLTPQITVDAYSLPGKFHDDPADRMIVATARSRDCILLTQDEKILEYAHVRKA